MGLEIQQEQVGRSPASFGGPIGGEDQTSPVGAGAGIEILIPVRGERLELAAR